MGECEGVMRRVDLELNTEGSISVGQGTMLLMVRTAQTERVRGRIAFHKFRVMIIIS